MAKYIWRSDRPLPKFFSLFLEPFSSIVVALLSPSGLSTFVTKLFHFVLFFPNPVYGRFPIFWVSYLSHVYNIRCIKHTFYKLSIKVWIVGNIWAFCILENIFIQIIHTFLLEYRTFLLIFSSCPPDSNVTIY